MLKEMKDMALDNIKYSLHCDCDKYYINLFEPGSEERLLLISQQEFISLLLLSPQILDSETLKGVLEKLNKEVSNGN